MNDWRIIVAVGIICILAWALIEARVTSAIGLRRLKKRNRCIAASNAVEEHEAGLGRLVLNESLLPGRWWFLRNCDRPENYDLVNAVREFGYIVVSDSRQERKLIEQYNGKVEVMLDPFED